MDRPKLIRDYKGGYLQAKRPVRNGWCGMPAGTVFKVESSGVTAHLESDPCDHCLIQMRVSLKGKNKFDDFEWLGYEHPNTQQSAQN